MQLGSIQTGNWREALPVHPAADLLPLLEPEQLAELADDIKTNGLIQPIVFFKDTDGNEVLADGRNRIDALQQLGLVSIGNGGITIEGYPDGAWKREDDRAGLDPYGYVIGANIRRRHLTAGQRHALIESVIKVDPAKSNRQIGEIVDRDHKTVAAVRDKLERRGEIPQVDIVTDTKGRRHPAHKVTSRTTPLRQSGSSSPRSRAKARVPNSRAEKILGIMGSIHSLAANCLDVKPQDLMPACNSEAKRSTLFASARLARDWLDTLLVESNSPQSSSSSPE